MGGLKDGYGRGLSSRCADPAAAGGRRVGLRADHGARRRGPLHPVARRARGRRAGGGGGGAAERARARGAGQRGGRRPSVQGGEGPPARAARAPSRSARAPPRRGRPCPVRSLSVVGGPPTAGPSPCARWSISRSASSAWSVPASAPQGPCRRVRAGRRDLSEPCSSARSAGTRAGPRRASLDEGRRRYFAPAAAARGVLPPPSQPPAREAPGPRAVLIGEG